MTATPRLARRQLLLKGRMQGAGLQADVGNVARALLEHHHLVGPRKPLPMNASLRRRAFLRLASASRCRCTSSPVRRRALSMTRPTGCAAAAPAPTVAAVPAAAMAYWS